MSVEQEPRPAFDQPAWGDIFPNRDSGWDPDYPEDLTAIQQAEQQADEEGAQ